MTILLSLVNNIMTRKKIIIIILLARNNKKYYSNCIRVSVIIHICQQVSKVAGLIQKCAWCERSDVAGGPTPTVHGP